MYIELPSPTSATTGRFGRASFTPSAAGSPQPMPPPRSPKKLLESAHLKKWRMPCEDEIASSTMTPVDVLNAERDLDLGAPTRVAPRIVGDRAAVARAAELLAKAQNPVIIAGDAVAHGGALAELAEVAELLGAPVITEGVASTCSFPFTHPLHAGSMPRTGPPIRALLMHHDLLFSVGGDLFTLAARRRRSDAARARRTST